MGASNQLGLDLGHKLSTQIILKVQTMTQLDPVAFSGLLIKSRHGENNLTNDTSAEGHIYHLKGKDAWVRL